MTESASRSSLIRKNILFSFLIKGWSGGIQLLIVPLTIFCLGNYENGIWMTISSILLWIDSLDIGLGNGLRNRLATNLAHGDIRKARENVSTTFFMLIFIITPVTFLLLLAVYSADMYSLFNVDAGIIGNLRQVMAIAVIMVCLTFIFKFIGNVYLGLQLPAVNNALVVGGQTLALAGTYAVYMSGVHSLFLVATVYTMAPLVVYIVAYPVTFIFVHPELRPSFRYFRKDSVAELFGLGIKFFIMQIAGLVIFATANTLISRFFSPDLVTPYQVAYRYLSVTMMVFTIIGVPFWSATTDAYERKDMEWIKRSLRKIHLTVALLIAVITLMTAVSGFIYPLWVGTDVHIPFSLTAGMGVYISVIMVSMSYSYMLNGIGKLDLQIICTVTAAVLYVPLSWLFSRWFGLTGMIMSLTAVNIPGMIVNMIQFNKLMHGTANGIWGK